MAAPTDHPTETQASEPSRPGAKADPKREERLAEALRRNLRRRKAAAQAGGDR